MKIIVGAVAEHAWVEKGCLSLCKTFDTIRAEKFPYKIPRFSIALRLLIRRSEVGQHKLNISLVDPDGKKLMNSSIDMNVKLPPEFIPESAFSFVLNGQNVIFPKPGDYAVDILIDEKIATSIPVYIREKLKKVEE